MKKTMQVVMLTTKKAEVGENIIHKSYDGDTLRLWAFDDKEDSKVWIPQHLYITSNDKIIKGDYFIESGIVRKCDETEEPNWIKSFDVKISGKSGVVLQEHHCTKIIASTDCNITPKSWIPESFVNAYIKSHNEGNVITDIDLEYEPKIQKLATGEEIMGSESEYNMKVKTRLNGSVVISQSKSYNRNEVITILRNFRTELLPYDEINEFELNKFIDKNI